jgi:hypothetical protein
MADIYISDEYEGATPMTNGEESNGESNGKETKGGESKGGESKGGESNGGEESKGKEESKDASIFDPAYMIPGIFLFYMIVFCNFLPELVGCKLQVLLKKSMFAKHVLGFFILFFLVVYVSPPSKLNTFYQNILTSLAVYVLFLMTTRTYWPFMLIILFLVSVMYIMQSNIKEEKDEDKVKRTKKWQRWVATGAIAVIVTGFSTYTYFKYVEYGKDFHFFRFLLGHPSCKGMGEVRRFVMERDLNYASSMVKSKIKSKIKRTFGRKKK